MTAAGNGASILKPKTKSTGMLSLLMVLLLVFSSPPPPIFAAQGRLERASQWKIARDLENLDAGSSVDVIIQFTRPPQDEDFAGAAKSGAVLKSKLGIINGGLFRVPAPALQGLARNPNVRFISPDRSIGATMDYSRPAARADIAQSYGWNGQGIGVAIVDSGIEHQNHADVSSRVVYVQNFASDDYRDAFGHGTHVASIVAGTAVNSGGLYMGVAPAAKLLSLRVLNSQGSGTDGAVIAAIQRAIELKTQYNIRVINLSLGRQVMESHTLDPLCQAVKSAWQAGIVVVVAAGNAGRNNSAGNNGYGTIASPGNSPYVITVGALNTNRTLSVSDDVVATFSSKGPTAYDYVVKPDLVAPGNRIIGALDPSGHFNTKYPWWKVNSYYIRLSGTSMATPMVSGAVALLLQKEPYLTPDQVKARLMKTARKYFVSAYTTTNKYTGEAYTVQHDIFTVGAGALDVYAALSSNEAATCSTSTLSGNTLVGASYTTNGTSCTALSPTVTQDPTTGEVKLLYANGVIWGTSVIWGTGVVWGTSVIWGNSVIWGSSGTEVNGTGVIWGTSVIWGTGVIWGTSDMLED